MKKTILSTLFLFGLCVFSFAQTDIRQIDFKNFTFEPFCVGEEAQKVTVKDGEFSEEKEADGYTERFYFKVYDFKYADVNGDGQEEAIISSVCNTGGTGYFTEGFIYTLKNGKPTILARIAGGDRAYGGLRSIDFQNGLIVVERSDVGESGGACCPEFAVKTSYKLSGDKLTEAGTETRRELYPKVRVRFARGTSKSVTKVKVGDISRFVIGARAGQTLIVSVNSKDVSASLLDGDADTTDLENGFTAKLKQTGDYVIQLQNLGETETGVILTIEIR